MTSIFLIKFQVYSTLLLTVGIVLYPDNNCVSFGLTWVFICRLSQVTVSGSYSLVAVFELLNVASFVAEL